MLDFLKSFTCLVHLLHPECYNVAWTTHEAFLTVVLTMGTGVTFLEIYRKRLLVSTLSNWKYIYTTTLTAHAPKLNMNMKPFSVEL